MSHGVVGQKIVTYLTAVRDVPGPWFITEHRVVDDLHATKGWRAAGHGKRVTKVKSLPPVREWRAYSTDIFKRFGGPLQKGGVPVLKGIRP